MQSITPQASCLHRKHDKSRRDARSTCTALAFATDYHQWPSGVYESYHKVIVFSGSNLAGLMKPPSHRFPAFANKQQAQSAHRHQAECGRFWNRRGADGYVVNGRRPCVTRTAKPAAARNLDVANCRVC